MTLKQILEFTEELNTLDYIGTDKNTTHCFIDFFYEKEFEKYKDKNISLLEIGIKSGGSLYLWGKYFKNGQILGIDIADQSRKKWKCLSNISHIIHDAYDEKFNKDLKNFDIIIDDGPHTLESQILCIKQYLPKLNKDGILVIEDICDINHFKILKNNTPEEFHGCIETFDLRHVKNRYDDLLFVIRN
jgi:hypothetical protein